jgi:ribosomal protein L29
MKTKDLREKSVEELKALLDEQQLNQFRLRMAKQLVNWVNRTKCTCS